MDSVSGSIYAIKDEICAGTPTSVQILDVLDLVDDCSDDAFTHYHLPFGVGCQVSFPWKELVQACRAIVLSICEGVESIPGKAVERPFWSDSVVCLTNRW
jgi:hypothetical protein